MNHQTQDFLTDIEHPIVTYSKFWPRFFASLIDGLILLPIGLIDNYNKSTWKSFPLLAFTFVVTLAYKPLLELKYKATLGKMAMKLTIVDTSFGTPIFKNIILRNIINIISTTIIGTTTFITFASEEFLNVTSVSEFSTLANALTGATWLMFVVGAISITDAIFLIADDRRRALHDRIGQTFVIEK